MSYYCQHPSHGGPAQATHGLAGGELTKCANHAEAGMVLLSDAQCDSETHGQTRAKAWYGNPGEPATKCRTHAEPGMENKALKRCDYPDCTQILPIFGYNQGVEQNPTHGFPGFIETVTAESATEFMVDYRELVCQYNDPDSGACTAAAAAGHSYEPALYCELHRQPNMKKTWGYRTQIAATVAEYGFPGETEPFCCASHREPGTIKL